MELEDIVVPIFTKDIIVLGTKATNKHNTYGVCIACDDALGREEALKSSLTNKKNTVRNHLKKCPHFRAKLGSQEAVDTYCNKTDNEEELTSQIVKRHRNTDVSDDNNTSDITSSSTTSTVSNHNSNQKSSTTSNLATIHESPLDSLTQNSDNELGQSSTNLDKLYLPRDITSILLNNNFWHSVKLLHSLLLPYCEVLNKLQSDTARLH
ncbi:7850_t:CDS:2 [Cetraspora pellucida]|uniref:7850_t:CDS:1 n=1 Tax=Cetraspora pellucida TaxID=1433469 RepID=A0ACA9LK24_9GLOM|nr:7850_t:CDS:2 [Cetraspora pellucida]